MRIYISAWFGVAGIMFFVACLGLLAWPNLANTASAHANKAFSFYSTAGLVIVGVICLVLGFADSPVGSERVAKFQ